MACIWRIPALILFTSPLVFAASGDDFSNNLFSDLAPLLTLFGERFAQQFLSESFSWLDHIVFAMAPLGIVTALVGAIRVGGPTWLKALVGRAREHITTAELELMSSTSSDVCELYNGRSVVRTVGRPVVKQLIYVEGEEKEHGLFTLENSEDVLLKEYTDDPFISFISELSNHTQKFKGFAFSRWIQASKQRVMNELSNSKQKVSDEENTIDEPRKDRQEKTKEAQISNKDVEVGTLNETRDNSVDTQNGIQDQIGNRQNGKPGKAQVVKNGSEGKLDVAPNISLNIHGGSNPVELSLSAVVGIILQLGVLVYSGFVAYHPRMKLRLGGLKSKAGFPLQASGTIFLTIGMWICSYIIEQSTIEERWVANRNRSSGKELLGQTTQKDISSEETDSQGTAAKRAAQESEVKKVTASGEAAATDNMHPLNVTTSMTDGKALRILWLQKAFSVGDQSFSSFFLTPDSAKPQTAVLTSHQCEGWDARYLTVIGVTFGIIGFIAQFEGFRLSNWSCTIAQLVAVFLMTALRAVVRRGLTQRPATAPLHEGYELDWLALNVARDPKFIESFSSKIAGSMGSTESPKDVNSAESPDSEKSVHRADGLGWEIMTPEDSAENLYEPSHDTFPSRSNANKAVRVRQRLGELTGWKGPTSKEAIALAAAIEEVLNSVEIKSLERFTWSLMAKLDGEPGRVNFTAERRKGQPGKDKLWEANSTELDAILSLWSYQFWKEDRNSHGLKQNSRDWLRSSSNFQARRCRRVLGRNTVTLYQDLAWWIGEAVAKESQSKDETQSEADILWFGFDGFKHDDEGKGSLETNQQTRNGNPEIKQRLVVNSPWTSSMMQHIFSGFMWAIAEKIPSTSFRQAVADPRAFNVNFHDTWNLTHLENAKLLEMARKIESSGLGTLEQVYLSIIPPLSYAHLLPDEAVVDLVLRQVLEYETDCRWGKAAEAYLKLLDISIERYSDPPDKFVRRTVAASIEFLLQVTAEPTVADSDEGDDFVKIKKPLLESKLKTSVLEDVAFSFRPEYEKRGQKDQFGKLFGNGATDPGNERKGEKKGKVENPFDYDNFTNAFGWTHLQKNVFYGSATQGTEASFLWDKGLGLINMTDISGRTILHYAAKAGYQAFAQRLLRNGAKVNAKGRDGKLPIHCAVESGSLGVVEVLLRKQQSLVNAVDNVGRTALHLAAWTDQWKIVELLLRMGSDVEAKDRDGWTPLWIAVWSGYDAIVSLLLLDSGNPDVKARDEQGRTPLWWAAMKGYEAVVQLLVEKGKADTESKDRYSQTPLLVAAQNGHDAVVRVLLDGKSDVESKDGYDQTPLWLAAQNGHEAVARLLCEKGKADVEAKDWKGRTPIWVAASKGHESIVRLLCEIGKADVNAKDSYGETPLSVAVWGGHEAVVRVLCEIGKANVEIKDRGGRTPLWWAAWNGQEAIVRLLCEVGNADIETMDEDGWTPIQGAKLKGHEAIVQLLETYTSSEPLVIVTPPPDTTLT